MALFDESEVVASHKKLATFISAEIEALYASTNLIRTAVLSAKYPEAGEEHDNFLAVSALSLRVVNNAGACTQLVDCGYFVQAGSQLRDTAETAMLIQLFSEKPDSISEWRKARKTRHSKFGRKTLEKNIIGNIFKFLDEYFNAYSQFGSHPSAESIIAHHDGSRFHLGPHYNENIYRQLYRDMAILTWHATDVCGNLWRTLYKTEPSTVFPAETKRFMDSWQALSTPILAKRGEVG